GGAGRPAHPYRGRARLPASGRLAAPRARPRPGASGARTAAAGRLRRGGDGGRPGGTRPGQPGPRCPGSPPRLDSWPPIHGGRMRTLYPEIEPYDTGTLAVDGRHTLYYEQCGNPDGKPVVLLHGGPGGGCTEKMRRFHDPAKYR